MEYGSIIIGCGFAGAVLARELADNGEKVLILEQRAHIGGNSYDELDSSGVLIHKYGPHIFHTNQKKVYEYLSKFTKWYDYSHKVAANVNGRYLPVPFNLDAISMVYGEEKGQRLKETLLKTYGSGTRVPILMLQKSEDPEIKELAKFVYENIFLRYTMKQWGQTPEEIEPSVSGRVPVLLSNDNRYFQDAFQGMPLYGYTAVFEKMLDHENIEVRLNTPAKKFVTVEKNKLLFEGELYGGKVVFTGAIDEFFDLKYGRLPYRSLRFVTEHYKEKPYQEYGVVNYTVSEEYTRITEYPYLTGQNTDGTTIMKEYPFAYTGEDGEIPYYAVNNEENMKLYQKYKEDAEKIANFYLLGRLAEYQYYNMDAIVGKALSLAREWKVE